MLGCQNIEEEDKTGKWFACFDFEAYQRDFDDRVDDVEMLQEGTSWNKIHVTVSFSVGCNLEGVETEHRSSKDPSELLSRFVDVLMEMTKKKYDACVEHYEHIFIMMDGLLERERSRMGSINPRTYTGDDLIKDKKGKIVSTMLLKELENVSARFESYCRELPVFGFNSAEYNIKSIKKYLFKELCKRDESPSFTVKKAGKYPCI